MRPLRLALLLILVTTLAGCAHRLTGPLHTADGPPWVAESAASDVPDLDLEHRVLLIGDAGYFLEDDPTLAALAEWAAAVDSATVVFLGDNVYNEGLTDEDRDHGEKILGQLLAATDVRKILVPGNHDWGFFPRNAHSIQNQQAFVDEWPGGSAEFVPKEGCTGPTLRILREAAGDRPAIVFIALDPTPWIQPRIRGACPISTSHADQLAALDAMLTEHENDHVVVGSHYPMLTGGPHGGLTYGVVVDMIVMPLGWIMGGLMNTYESAYADWITQTEAVFARHPPVIYAAGHDHNLQLLDAGDAAGLYIVSGAGARDRVSTVTNLEQTIFAHAAEGFVVVDFGTRDGRDAVVVRVIEPMVSADEPVHVHEIPID